MTRFIPPIVLLLAASLVVQMLALYPGHDWGGDFAVYIMQARALVEDGIPRVLENNAFVIQHSSAIIGPLAYPWGVPVLLAPLYALFGINMLAFKALNMGLFLIFLASLYAFARPRLPGFWALAYVGMFAFNNSFVDFAGQVTSDIPFVLFSTLTLLAMGRSQIEKKRILPWPAASAGQYADAVLLGLLCMLCCTLRGNGLFLPLTLLFVQGIDMLAHRHSGTLLQRLYWHALPLAIFLMSYGLWWVSFPSGDASYIASMNGLTPGMVWSNFLYNIAALGDFFVIPLWRDARLVALVITLPLALWGMLRHHRRYYHFMVYMAGTFLLFTIWPYRHGARFFLPLFPLYLFFVFLTLAEAEDYARRTGRDVWLKYLRLALCGVMVFMTGVTLVSAGYRALPGEKLWKQEGEYGPYTPMAQDLFRFVRENTAPDSVLVFFKPRVLTLFTDRRTAMLLAPEHFTQAHRGGYVCIYRWQDSGYGQMKFADVQHMVEQGRLEKVYANRDYDVFRIL